MRILDQEITSVRSTDTKAFVAYMGTVMFCYHFADADINVWVGV